MTSVREITAPSFPSLLTPLVCNALVENLYGSVLRKRSSMKVVALVITIVVKRNAWINDQQQKVTVKRLKLRREHRTTVTNNSSYTKVCKLTGEKH